MSLNNKTLQENSSKKIFINYLIPSMLGMLAESSAVFIDGLFVANFISSEAFSAISIVWPITSISFALYIMLTLGSIAIAGKCIGQNNIMRASLIFTQTLISIVTLTTPILILIYIFKEKLLPLFGAHGNIYNFSLEYINGIIIAVFFWGITYVFSQFIRLNGSPKFALLMFITSSLVNIILDALFIIILKLGLSGAAWATAISYIISFIIGLSYFLNPKCQIKIIKIYAGYSHIFKAALNGFSEFLSNISSGIIVWLFNITAYKILGNNGILIYSAVNYIITFFIIIAADIGEILSSLISISYGAKNKNKMKDFLKIGIIFVSSVSISASIILLINPSILVNALLKNIDSKTIQDAMFFVRVSIPIFICIGINIIMSAYYTSIQKAGASALIAALRTIILPVLLILTLPNILGFLGLILVLPISEIITLIVSIALYKNRNPNTLIRD
ncbi:Na+-driven multidrug efflux pump [Brachyspira hampsonii 30446]|uniref:Na+-driven multidrug efflux pump n=1 Tax=Brachyspira hampsonii 30446 TaxID=1289135 RepID=A0A2U4FHS8_9SPIR|nr:MATE family efflux transporter [Brachyspira hampsonii]EKV56761.1 Na+-driven multidrug efflux pump [Brachyspira hampsonii 30446]MBW5393643.1 MATE family efflux transporter [Brachyspira hampsonii]OEJ20523.1 multidrug transporter [Brachyspira hampsonii]